MKISLSFLITVSVTIIFLGVNNFLPKQQGDIKIIKFMYSKEYLFDYGEKMFWDNTEEHAIMYQKKLQVKKMVERSSKSTSKSFKNYNYCFLVSTSKGTDTLYADFSLKAWIIKEKGKKIYYYDQDGTLAKDLRSNYTFFKDCW